ncbi:unnamed protein product, partial [Staurois parvus]
EPRGCAWRWVGTKGCAWRWVGTKGLCLEVGRNQGTVLGGGKEPRS